MPFQVGQYVRPKRFFRKRGFVGAIKAVSLSYAVRDLHDWNGLRSDIGRVLAVGPAEERTTTTWDPQQSADVEYTAEGPIIAPIVTVLVRDLDTGTLSEREYPDVALDLYTGGGEANGLHYDHSSVASLVEAQKAIGS